VVVAKKKTHPFIRLCGDYKRVNKFLRVPKYPIPDVIPELHKLIEYPLYLDCDLTNAYHQMPIAKRVSRLLSIQTPFGQFEPKFMPEGVSPASMALMAVMRDIFRDYLDWMVVIHDNMLVLCKNCEDAYEKAVEVDVWCEKGQFLWV
jgi:hypothetical protein